MTKTISDPIRNLTLNALISFMHWFHHSVWVVLKIWTFEFGICFGFRNSYFVFIPAPLILTGPVEPFRVHH